ncbi:MAG: hypothetical protein KDN18_01500 [Verrucomicrobiae bacterium]|nr:hypothetical protein [Verrucomicrobiae bacterium]
MSSPEELRDQIRAILKDESASRAKLPDLQYEYIQHVIAERKNPPPKDKKQAFRERMADLLAPLPELLGMNAATFCEKTGVTASSFSRWKSGIELPALHRIEDLEKVIDGAGPKRIWAHSIKLDDQRRITLRPYSQIMDRQGRCKRIWSIKHRLPFQAAAPGDIQNSVISKICDSGSEFPIEYHCIFWGPKNFEKYNAENRTKIDSDFPALDSFIALKQALCRETDDEEARSRLNGYVVNSDYEAAFKLGMSTLQAGLMILEYHPERIKGHKSLSHRLADFFIEQPHSVYGHSLHSLKSNDSNIRWGEIPPHISHWEWERIQPLLEDIAGRAPNALAKPFMDKPDEIARFRPRRFPTNG